MARWGKNLVVPLESLIKEKENTNRPIAARSAGTVGKWGKMGFTSIRTYAFKAAAVAGVSPSEIVPENNDVQNNSQSSDLPKPKKFFKSRNASVDIIRAQIQHLPRAPPSPIRDVSPKKEQQVIKIKIPKPKHERKKSTSSDKVPKPKKKKEGKKMKPEAPPSRVTSRQRKVVNYKEDDEDERSQTPLKDIISAVPAALNNSMVSSEEEQSNRLNTSNETSGEYDGEIGDEEEEAEPEIESEHEAEAVMEPPPVTPSKQQNLDHPPIVLRISKGTSRLISTDSEEVINSPVQQSPAVEQQHQTSVIASTEELLSVLSGEPVQKQQIEEQLSIKTNEEDQSVNATKEPEVNNIDESIVSTNAVESQKYESLKIVIKTDALKNAFISEKPEKKGKSRKHKKVTTVAASTAVLKTPSPKPPSENRTLMSPPPASEKDFDSQSSILGSVSSKGTNQFPAVIAEDSCVIRSHGSSDVTSDLETSQHSSLVAPPSDIESRLESMMDCDDDLPPLGGVEDSAALFGENDNKLMHIREEPLKEDILKILAGDDTGEVQKPLNKKEKKTEVKEQQKDNEINKSPSEDAISTRRMTRSRRGKVETENEQPVTETPVAAVEEKSPNKSGRVTRNKNNGNLKNNSTVLPPTRSYARKRKNVQSAPPLAPPPPPPPLEPEQNKEEENDDFAVDLPDTSSTIQTNNKYEETSTNKNETTKFLETPPKISEKSEGKEYKIKNKLKRTWYERNSKKTRGEEGKTDEPVAKKFNSRGRNNEEKMARNNNNNKNGEQTIENGETNDDDLSPLRLTNSSSSVGNDDDEKRSVKLVISKKKGSIFKSRALVSDQGGDGHTTKKRAVYKHTWDDDKEKSSCSGNTPTPSDSGGDTLFEDDFSNDTATITKFSSRITRQNIVNSGGNNDKFSVGDDIDNENGVTKVKCDRKAKDYYTVVRNVKTAHQIQEIGEYQEMKDDVDYILDALQPHNPISTRCLSALQLATKCLIPAFRMHVRAHGTVGKFFKALKDAKNDLSLGLCTATIMFALAQDTLNVDLDRDSLELMINLLEIDSKTKKKDSTITSISTTPTPAATTTAQTINSSTDSEENTIYERNKQKVRELCEEIKNQGKALHLNLDTITVGTLSMETLLSLTSKKAGEWFKEELRELGGLEHIIKTICDCCYQITDYVVNWTEYLLDKLRTIERCLRVLENVSQQNEINQKYILSYNNGYALDTLFKLYKLCDSEIALYPTNDQTPKDNPGVVLRETLVPTLKVLINLTHPFDTKAIGSSLLGQRQGIFDTSFHILLQAPNYVPERCIFELSILVLLLLINLTMYTIPNRQLIMKSHAPSDFGNRFDKVPAIKALIEYFYRCQEQALLAEQNTDEILENPESNKKKPQSQEEMDETVTKLLQKAGHHMEHTLQASYAGILIGHLISENSENETIIRSYLRNNKFEDIVSVLKKYYTFMDLTASSEATVVSHIKSTKILIDNFVKCDAETTTTHSNNDNDDDIGGISGNINENHHNHHHYNQSNNSSTNLDNSQHQLPSSSSQSSSISTRSATRYYKSYSGHQR